jgi:hypothetical protein
MASHHLDSGTILLNWNKNRLLTLKDSFHYVSPYHRAILDFVHHHWVVVPHEDDLSLVPQYVY